jgi:hypothetical protein
VDATDQVIEHFQNYFTFFSSDESVVKVEGENVRVVGSGSAVITAKLGELDATGMVIVNSTALPPTDAPDPTHPAADVISLFSNSYPNRPVDTWSADWDNADVSDLKINGNDTKGYTNMVFAGIEFASNPIDATAMTHFHIDAWAPTGNTFKIKLVDFGADGMFGGLDDSESELTFNPITTPPFNSGTWISLDIPMADFVNLQETAHLAQIVLSGNTQTVYIDNIYFHK